MQPRPMLLHGEPPPDQVWVLDDPRAGTSAQALGIAERLGLGFRRVPLVWNRLAHVAGLAPQGSLLGLSRPSGLLATGADTVLEEPHEGAAGTGPGPELVLSSGSRSVPVALWLRSRHGARLVHCMRPGGMLPGLGGGRIGGPLRGRAFELLVIPEHDRPALAENVMTVLGAPHRLSPLVLRQARAAWRERLAHLPHPRIALLVGGSANTLLGGHEMPPTVAHGLGLEVARLSRQLGGAVLATTSRRTGSEATAALAAGLSRSLHILYRWAEPGENPYAGILSSADVIVVTADSASMISEACATDAPVYVAAPELGGPRHARLVESLVRAGQVRRFRNAGTLIQTGWSGQALTEWTRTPLDEAGRVAREVIRRLDGSAGVARFGHPA